MNCEASFRRSPHLSAPQERNIEPLLLQLGAILALLSMISAALWCLNEEFVLGFWLWASPVILLLACVVTAFRLIHANFQMVISPVFWVLLASGVYWGFGPLVYSFGDESAVTIMNVSYDVGPAQVFATNQLNSVGMFVLVMGIVIGRRLLARRPLRWMRRFEGIDPIRVAGVFMIVGLGTKFFMVLPVFFGLTEAQSSAVLQVQVLSKAALVILSYLWTTKRGKGSALFLFLLVAELVAATFVNSKMAILEVFIAVLVGRALALRKTSTAVKGFATLGVLLLVLQPVISSYRLMAENNYGGTDYVSAVAETSALMTQSFSNLINGIKTDNEDHTQEWWWRLCYTPQQTFAMDQYDSGRPGSPREDLAIAFIPRVFWRDKPLINPGINFNVLFNGDETTSNAPGVLGEGYWYGGWVGLLIVCLYTGIFLGALDQISMKVVANKAWVFMPLVFVGVRNGFRIDGWFSTEFLVGSVWYALFAIVMFYGATSLLVLTRLSSRRITFAHTRMR